MAYRGVTQFAATGPRDIDSNHTVSLLKQRLEYDLYPEKAVACLVEIGTARARRAGIPFSHAEEYIQEYVIGMLESDHWKKWRSAKFSPRWAAKCAANSASDFRSKLGTLASHEVSAETCKTQFEGCASRDESPMTASMCAEIRRELDTTLDDLTDGQQSAVRLRFYEDLSLPEIAKLAGTTPDASRMTIARALLQLRKRLLELGFDDNEALGLLSPPPPRKMRRIAA
jgi:RNA polymerase sigma factor (sigma-70 family)